MLKPAVPNHSFADLTQPERKYYEDEISKLTEVGINHAACIEDLQNEIEGLKKRIEEVLVMCL